MGKTAEGAVWLNADMRSPYDYWQFWRNTEDGDVGRFLRLFTELPLEEISELEKLEGAGINEAKKRLANEATALAHGVVFPLVTTSAGVKFGRWVDAVLMRIAMLSSLQAAYTTANVGFRCAV